MMKLQDHRLNDSVPSGITLENQKIRTNFRISSCVLALLLKYHPNKLDNSGFNDLSIGVRFLDFGMAWSKIDFVLDITALAVKTEQLTRDLWVYKNGRSGGRRGWFSRWWLPKTMTMSRHWVTSFWRL
jgi:hypothetical protein